MPVTGSKNQIIMEYEHFTDTLANSTAFNSTVMSAETTEQLRQWMLSEPDLSYQYASMIIANMPSPRYKAYENSIY